MRERTMLFVDFQNTSIGAQTVWQSALDFSRLQRMLADGRHIMFGGAFVYLDLVIRGTPSAQLGSLLHYLRREGFNLVIPRVHTENTTRRKCVDTSITADMVACAYKKYFETAILVSGDSDFTPAVKAVQATGRKVEVASFRHALGLTLRNAADKLTLLDDHAGELRHAWAHPRRTAICPSR